MSDQKKEKEKEDVILSIDGGGKKEKKVQDIEYSPDDIISFANPIYFPVSYPTNSFAYRIDSLL